MKLWLLYLSVGVILVLTPRVEGHGYMLLPPGRSSAWRMNGTGYFHVNYNDNQNYCGGYGVQHNKENNGRCGICGDDYSLPRPRDNERGGYFDTGNSVAVYRQGSTIDVAVVITANHKGRFYFDLCPSNSRKQWETEKCFIPLLVEDTFLPYFTMTHGEPDTFQIKLQLPSDITCRYCVLRWKYITANSWGCEDDRRPWTCCTGCGNKQEHFYSCADVMITPTGSESVYPWKKIDPTKTTTPRPTTTRYPSTTTTLRTTTTRRTTTRRPRRTLRPTKPTTPTTTTTESPVCTVWCAKMCKPHLHAFCDRSLCKDCINFRQFINN